jgi:hypothetical protein
MNEAVDHVRILTAVQTARTAPGRRAGAICHRCAPVTTSPHPCPPNEVGNT